MDAAKLDLRAKGGWRSTKNHLMTGLMVLALVAVALPLLAVMASVLSRGLGIMLRDFPAFFTKEIPEISTDEGAGMGPAIVGTLLCTLAASLMAVPLGILGAIYLHEYGGNGRLARLVRFMATVMTGVPSIVMGLFIFVVWILTAHFSYSAFAGSIALACLMLPVVIGTTEQMLKLVPNHLREASYALGTTKSRTILTVVLPAALPGIVSGALLAVARAAGETAPLMFVLNTRNDYNTSLFSGANTTLSLQIFSNASSAFEQQQERAWGAAITLMLLTFIITLVARAVTARFAMKR